MIDTNRTLHFIAFCCLSFAVVFVLAAIASGVGTRFGWWGFRTGLSLLRWTAYGEAAVMAVAAIGCIIAYSRGNGNGLLLFVLAGIICTAALSVPLRMYLIARSVPAIHDITTDTSNPPQFDAVLGLRKDALNSVEYGGEALAEQQKKAYPDIVPLLLELPPVQVFERVLAYAKGQGWAIVNADAAKLVIEATDTTFWFGFKDDVVIRIVPEGGGSRVDVRSLSRVGRSDVGANAARIRSFMAAMKKGA